MPSSLKVDRLWAVRIVPYFIFREGATPNKLGSSGVGIAMKKLFLLTEPIGWVIVTLLPAKADED